MSKDKNKPIGVFDSGMGGISVLANLIHKMPNESYIYYGDSFNAPYGIKKLEHIKELSIAVCDFLVKQDVKAIVVACNTATSAAIKDLRTMFDIPIIGMEPALKPAIEGNRDGKSIIVMATETTLREKKFEALMTEYGKDSHIIKLPASGLVELVENSLEDSLGIENYLRDILSEYDLGTISSIVLGCTHFIFIEDILKSILPDSIQIVDGNMGTTNHLESILHRCDILLSEDIEGDVTIYNSTNDDNIIRYSERLLINRLEKLNDKAANKL